MKLANTKIGSGSIRLLTLVHKADAAIEPRLPNAMNGKFGWQMQIPVFQITILFGGVPCVRRGS
jgi:hypothetical protein